MLIRRFISGRFWLTLFVFFLLSSPLAFSSSHENSSEKEKSKEAESKEAFNLILSYTDLTVGPGQKFEMDAEVVNRRKDPVHVSLDVESVPEGWEVGFHSRYPSFPVRAIVVKGGDEKSQTLELKAKIPDKIDPGDYEIKVVAKDRNGTTTQTEKVMFRVTSKKVETGGLKIESQYPVLSGPTRQTFKFSLDLKNEADKDITTALAAQAPPGWRVRIKPQFEETQISSIALKKDASQTLSVEIDPPFLAEPGEYPVTLSARSGSLQAEANLKITLTGTYDFAMGIPTKIGDQLALRLSTSVTVGEKSVVDFLVANTGTAPLQNLSFDTAKPPKWAVDFKPDKIDLLNPGDPHRTVKMEIQTAERTVAGDYLFTVNANSKDANKSVEVRGMVSTPTWWWWIGIGIIAVVILGLGAVFVRLGRR
jgi:uncharacterized membrane protein